MKLETLFTWYKLTREWRKLKPNSKIMYQQMMNNALEYFEFNRAGERISLITAKVVDAWYSRIEERVSISKAVSVMKVMRRIWNVAKRNGHVAINPFEKMGLTSTNSRKIIWTEEQVHEVFNYSYYTGEARDVALLVYMCYYLGQRPGDMIKLRLNQYNKWNKTVTFIQEKTDKHMQLPVPDKLNTLFSVIIDDGKHTTFIIEQSSRELNKQFNWVKVQLNFPRELQIRDLRRTAITETLESGASDAEAQAISGHDERDMLNTYAPSTLKMATSAMEKRFSQRNQILI